MIENAFVKIIETTGGAHQDVTGNWALYGVQKWAPRVS